MNLHVGAVPLKHYRLPLVHHYLAATLSVGRQPRNAGVFNLHVRILCASLKVANKPTSK